MKKTIITIAAIVSFSASAFAQGSLSLQSSTTLGGVSTATANTSTANWYTGPLTLEVFAVQSNSVSQWTTAQSDITAINSAATTSGQAAFTALTTDGWLQQTVGGASSASAPVSGGAFNIGIQTIGTSGTLPTSATATLINTIYAIVGIEGGLEGVLVFNPSSSGAPSPGTPINDASVWPNQNLYLTAVPEPSTMALAGLGGLAALLFRRKK